MKIKLSQLRELISEQIQIIKESQASEEAKNRGLEHKGHGRYADKSGKIVAQSKDGKLVPVGKEDNNNQKKEKPEIKKKSEVKFDLSDAPTEYKNLESTTIDGIDEYVPGSYDLQNKLDNNKAARMILKKDLADIQSMVGNFSPQSFLRSQDGQVNDTAEINEDEKGNKFVTIEYNYRIDDYEIQAKFDLCPYDNSIKYRGINWEGGVYNDYPGRYSRNEN